MSDDWLPRVKPEPVVADPAPVVKEQPTIVVVPDTTPRPKSWEFIPVRDDDLLIVKIIARPVY
jgi:hypothetical protein